MSVDGFFDRVCIVWLVGLLTVGSIGRAQEEGTEKPKDGRLEFTLRIGDKSVRRLASTGLIAIRKGPSISSEQVAKQFNFEIVSRNEYRDPGKSKLDLFRMDEIEDAATAASFDKVLSTFAEAKAPNVEVQPVFEAGQALLVPNDEIIVRVGETDRDKVRSAILEGFQSDGVVDVKPHRKNSLLIKIKDPSKGRSYDVAEALSEKLKEQIEYAEPNHQIFFFNEPKKFVPKNDVVPLDATPDAPKPLGGFLQDPTNYLLEASPIVNYEESAEGPESEDGGMLGWTVLVDQDFEGDLTGWTTGSGNNKSVYWSTTTREHKSGSTALYATGGGTAGKTAPGPYPHGVSSWIETPELDLGGSEETYVGFWFRAKYNKPGSQVQDYGRVSLRRGSNLTPLDYLAVAYTGDLTADPTTDHGWRRMLVRVPPKLRGDGCHIRVEFFSNDSGNDEGLYVDDFRVVSLTEWPATPTLDDPYVGRQYEHDNRGQIAGLGGATDDLNIPEALEQLGEDGVDTTIVVAVIDDGVDLTHPDLNLEQGYDWNGSLGGGPRGNHGSACAGDVGAVSNNGAGVIGTAPGVRIMPIYSGGTIASLAVSIDLAVAKEATIASNSWGIGGGFYSAAIRDSCADAIEAGVHLVFAAGNGPDRPPYTYDVAFPGNLCDDLDLICVGACSPTAEHKATASSDGAHSWGSSYIGEGPNVVAPSPWGYTTDRGGSSGYNNGDDIDPADPDSADYTPSFGGTSHATPMVAGVVALVLSANDDLTPAQVKTILMDTARDIDDAGHDDKTGAGLVNAFDAVKAAQELR